MTSGETSAIVMFASIWNIITSSHLNESDWIPMVTFLRSARNRSKRTIFASKFCPILFDLAPCKWRIASTSETKLEDKDATSPRDSQLQFNVCILAFCIGKRLEEDAMLLQVVDWIWEMQDEFFYFFI